MAGGKSATLALKITGDARDGVRALDDVEDKAGRMDGVFGKAGAGIAAGIGVGVVAIGGLAVAAGQAASDLQQSTGAIDSVFGDWALDIEQAAQGAADSVGLSTSSYENLAAVIGAQLSGAGFAHDQMNDKAQSLIATGADLAATFGGTTADAVEALSSVMKGEFDPIERYGVSLKQSDINARLAADGNDHLTGTALKTATANAALALISEQTASSVGAFAREGDTAAGAQERLAAKVENIKAAIGEKLLPIFVTVVGFISDKVIPYFGELTEKGGPLSDMFGKVSAFITDKVVPAAKDLAKWIGEHVIPVWADISRVIREVAVPAFEKIWGYVSDYVIPVFKTVLPPIIDGARDVIHKLSDKLIENKDKFQEIYDKVKPFLDFMRDTVAPFIGGVLKLAFEGLSAAIGPVVDTIAWILDKAASVVGFIGSVGGAIGGLFGAGPDGAGESRGAAPAGSRLVGAPLGAALPLRTATAAPAGSSGSTATITPVLAGGDTYNITVTGALDADAVAEQIEALLTRRARLTGRQLAGALT